MNISIYILYILESLDINIDDSFSSLYDNGGIYLYFWHEIPVFSNFLVITVFLVSYLLFPTNMFHNHFNITYIHCYTFFFKIHSFLSNISFTCKVV